MFKISAILLVEKACIFLIILNATVNGMCSLTKAWRDLQNVLIYTNLKHSEVSKLEGACYQK